MMELTPLDVRKKKGDFRRGLRGYEPGVVDDFLDLVADRLESLVREAAASREKVARLEQQVADYRDREKALTEALVTAQEMREEIRAQSAREVDLIRREAEQEAEGIRGDAVRAREREEESLNALRTRQLQFLASYRAFLEQELAELAAHARATEMQAGRTAAPARAPAAAPARPQPAPAPAPRHLAGSRASPGPAVPPTAGQVKPAAAVPAPAPPRDPAAEEIDAHVGAALAEWTTEFDELPAGEEPDLILSDADVVVEEGTGSASWAPAPAAAPEPAAPPSRFDDPAFREEISAAFGDKSDAHDSLLDLDSFDSLRRSPDPALGESIVGPPPVIPPEQLTISPVFLERAGTADPAPPEEPAGTEEAPRRDRFSSMFEDDG
jgi:DivIVA domain-containing protein